MRFSSCARQSIRSHRTGALRGWSSGPFTRRAAAVTPATAGTTYRPPSHTGVEKLSPVIASNLPFGSGGPGRLASPAHLPHVSALSRPGTRPGIRPVMPRPGRRAGQDGAGFPLPFGRRPSLPGHPVPPGDSAPLTIGLPRPPAGGADPNGVSMFRTRKTRPGPGALFTPGTAVPSRPVDLPGRRTPPFNGRSLFTPVDHSAPGCNCDEASSRVHWRSPLPAFPSPVIPGRYGDPRAFP